ncbi:MAG: 4-phosphoerythronate dehydrogenase [Tannerella sp.]|jgi:erythronate-4-phosphate dehydrogenase|nr:4-phosphoerythronate dehydrogenase [Tannerella sp.]
MRRLNIVADDKIPFLRGALEPYADIVYLPGAGITPADVADADAIFTRTRTKCHAGLLQGSRVKLIATATIGYDHIDTAYCEANGIRWVNAPGCNSSSVQQYITAALVTLANAHGLRFPELTLGVVGVGNVGSKVAKAGAALGMRVLLNDPPRADKEGQAAFTPLDELLEQSDIVTCHTPLAKEAPYPTYHLASDAFFERMKEGAVFINSSRGQVTDSAALKRAAQSKLSNYLLDVWEGEPTPDPVLLEGAFIGTPHIAGYSSDGKANGTAACIHELCRFFGLDILPDWYPALIPSPPMPVILSVDCKGKTGEQVFYEAVTHTYPIGEDSLRLKQSPETFEEQRGNYWIRREFGAFTLCLNDAEAAVAEGLAKLGFHIIQ